MLTVEQYRQMAVAAGFDDAGAAKVVRLDADEAYLQQWLNKNYNGSMTYMANEQEKRVNPQAMVPTCKTVLVCLLNYYKEVNKPQEALFVSQSGLSIADYHLAVKSRLRKLEQMIIEVEGEGAFSAEYQHLFCDSAPVLERRWAVKAGLGWIGKNKQFIHPQFGSFVHIGILFADFSMDDATQEVESKCGECNLCIEHCPTGALRTDMFDARKCIAYLTIERKEPLDKKYNGVLKNVLYGCDRCANVCPYNSQLKQNQHEDLQVNEQLVNMTSEKWQTMSKRQKLKLIHRLAD